MAQLTTGAKGEQSWRNLSLNLAGFVASVLRMLCDDHRTSND
jgi:hypothetical protein